MPIFEYECSQCDHRFETIVLSANHAVACPKCQSGAVKKQLSSSIRAAAARKKWPAAADAAARRKPVAPLTLLRWS